MHAYLQKPQPPPHSRSSRQNDGSSRRARNGQRAPGPERADRDEVAGRKKMIPALSPSRLRSIERNDERLSRGVCKDDEGAPRKEQDAIIGSLRNDAPLMVSDIGRTLTPNDHAGIVHAPVKNPRSMEGRHAFMSQRLPLPPTHSMSPLSEQAVVKTPNLLPMGAIDDRDKGTPDSWVARHPSLLRLTGRHPFNAEPPLPVLVQHGHQVPASLHYVRNHGAVPVQAATNAERDAVYDSWTINVCGLVNKELLLSIADLEALPRTRLSCLITCSGNRRKEQNMVKQTIGFNWGPTAASNSEWEGCRLSDVLMLAGIKSEEEGAKHVLIRGPQNELPKGKDGSYGTSITRRYALNPDNDVLLAFLHNGERLAPDHGFPLRVIVPGYTGGRMIKWLKEVCKGV